MLLNSPICACKSFKKANKNLTQPVRPYISINRSQL